jgi:uncharacterized membrane protein HdeD (DUF308 family)
LKEKASERRSTVVGLGILALIIGVILWLTVMPAIGWILMVIGVILIIAGILLGAVWGFSRAARGGPAY